MTSTPSTGASRCGRKAPAPAEPRARRTPLESAALTNSRSARRLRRVSSGRSGRAAPARGTRAAGRHAEVGRRPAARKPRRGRARARPLACGAPGRRRPPQHGARMLDVVVERPIHVGHLARRHRHRAEPVIVELPARPGRKRKRPLDQRAGGRGTRRRRSCSRSAATRGWCGCCVGRRHIVSPRTSPLGRRSLSRCRRARRRRSRLSAPRACPDTSDRPDRRGRRARPPRGHRERPLEVPVEAEARVRARDDEAGVPSTISRDLVEALRLGAVVADQADPVRSVCSRIDSTWIRKSSGPGCRSPCRPRSEAASPGRPS